MNFKSIPLTAIALLTATGATAQGTQYLSYGADYTSVSSGGESIDLFSVGASIDFRVNNAFVNAGISFADVSGDGGGASITAVTARGGFFVTPQAVIYGGLNYADASESESFSAYNIGGEYSFGAITVGLNYDDSSEDGYIDSTTLYGSYQVSDALEVALGVTDTNGDTTTQLGFDFDNGQYEINALFADSDGVNLFGIDASYDLGNSFRVSGNYTNIDGEADILSIGGGYQVSQDMWLDLEVGRISVDGGGSGDIIGLALTYETGRETLLIDRAQSTQVQALGALGQLGELGGL